jgi:hypothetical protein
MNRNPVVCIAFSRVQSLKMVDWLKAAAFSSDDICVLSATGPSAAALRNMVRGLISQGIPLPHASHYEEMVMAGHTLVSVLTRNADEVTLAEVIFTKAGGRDICATTGESVQHYDPIINPRRKELSEVN